MGQHHSQVLERPERQARAPRASAGETSLTPNPLAAVLRDELARLRNIIRGLGGAVPEKERRRFAADLVCSVFLSLAQKAAPRLQLTSPSWTPSYRFDKDILSIARELADRLAASEVVEAVHFLASLYTTLLPGAERSAFGAFYTPPALAGRLIALSEEHGVDWSSAKVLDPASGGGAFLMPVAQRMREALASQGRSTGVLESIADRLLGLEIDPHAAWFSQAGFELVFADLIEASGKPAPQIVRVCDSLKAPPSETFDLVIGNPPYGRVKLTDEQRAYFARSLYGHANLYGVFTDLALRWCKSGGLIAYLTPTSFLGGQYFCALRELLGSEAPPLAIDFVHSRKGVFEDALQETMLAIYGKSAKCAAAQVHYLRVKSEFEAELIRNGVIALPKPLSDPWLAPRSPSQSKLATAAATMTTRLSDLGYQVSTGPLVWNRFKDQLRHEKGKNAYPLIWAEAVTVEGQFVFRAQKRNHAPYFEAKPKDGWLLVSKPCVLLQRTTAKEQSRRLIAAELDPKLLAKHKAVVVENHLNMVRPIGDAPKVSAAVVAAVLNSTVADEVFRCISGSVAVSAFELEALPLPPVEQLGEIESLLAQGAGREEIEAALRRLYLPGEA